MMESVRIDVSQLYAAEGQAKIHCLETYETKCLEIAGTGADVVLTGAGPIWLFLRLAHRLHGKARSLSYESPVSGRLEIFNHDPF